MFSIRVTLVGGEKFFVNETDYKSGFYLCKDIKEAYTYETTLEFKVTWRLMRRIIEEVEGEGWFYKTIDYNFNNEEDVIKFETINHETLEAIEFDAYENEIPIGDKIYVDTDTFNRLKVCSVNTSQWTYDKNDNWLPFAEEKKELDDVFRIRYWRRGLLNTISSHNNWLDRYDEHSWNSSYERHHKTMLNPIIQQIVLLRHQYNHEYNIFEEKL